MTFIDDFLNKITMYRLVVYALAVLTVLGFIFALLGRLPYAAGDMLIALVLLLAVTYITDRLFAYLFKVPANMESWLITALILFLIIPAPTSLAAGLSLGLAGFIASASKYLIAWRGKHIFNPAALAAAFLSIWGLWPTTWWVGSSLFWPVSLVLGLLVARKIRRLEMVAVFWLITIGLQAMLFIQHHQPLGSGLQHAIIASPLIFLSTIMLTEPATMPPRRWLQWLFAAGVAGLYVKAEAGPFIIYPEVALLIGNIGAYIVSPKLRVKLYLQRIEQVSERVYTYVFKPDFAFAFLPGQYMEWTLPNVPYDNRGNRRTFTIASSPTETEVRLGLKYYNPASSFKAAFYDLKPGDVVFGSQLAGNFTLKGHEHQKLAFVAGGIGITPFRSMIKYLTDRHMHTDLTVLYLVSDSEELAYLDDLRQAAAVGVRTIPVLTGGGRADGIVSAELDADLIVRAIPDYAERLFYVSGPNRMVETAKADLLQLGVSSRRIKTDYFSGY